MKSRTVAALVFPGFELLDLFGPLEVFGAAGGFRLVIAASKRGPVASAQGPRVFADVSLRASPAADLILVPGGIGTRREVRHAALLSWLSRRAARTPIVASVCTGAALLARAGLLDGRLATTNRRAFAWVASQGPRVRWDRRARWVDEGRVATSAGVSAGIDLALHLVARLRGRKAAQETAKRIEYASR